MYGPETEKLHICEVVSVFFIITTQLKVHPDETQKPNIQAKVSTQNITSPIKIA